MTFNNETSVLLCEDGHHLPTVQFDFTGIGDLESKSKDSLVGASVAEGRAVMICPVYGLVHKPRLPFLF